MLGDEAAVAPMGIGTPRVSSVEFRVGLHDKGQRDRECLARKQVSRHQRKVLHTLLRL